MKIGTIDPVWLPWTSTLGDATPQTVSLKYETPSGTADLTKDQTYIWGPSESEYSSDDSSSSKLSAPPAYTPAPLLSTKPSSTKPFNAKLPNTKSASTKASGAKSSSMKSTNPRPSSTKTSNKTKSSTTKSSPTSITRPSSTKSPTVPGSSGSKSSSIRPSSLSSSKKSTSTASSTKPLSTKPSTQSGSSGSPSSNPVKTHLSGSSSVSGSSETRSSSSGSSGSSGSASSASSLTTQSVQKRIPWEEDRRWPSSQRKLTVRFLNGSHEQRSLIKKVVRENYNTIPLRIRFSFLPSRDTASSDIRIKFTDSGPSWALVGTIDRPSHEETMALNLDYQDTAEDTVGTILHEFGHALGLKHEHRHSDSGLIFSRRHMRSNGYDDKGISELWQPVGIDKRRTEPYDKLSIMHYAITTKQVKNLKTPIGRNNSLSTGDKNQLIAMYPPDKTTTTTTTIKKKQGKAKPKSSEPVGKIRPPLKERTVPNEAVPTATIKYGGETYEYATQYTDRKGKRRQSPRFNRNGCSGS
ncbi:hypothetical protein PG993_007930 [Apiospora rasikravindrae]|uniref:Metalloendopeptidase n=1 Tax=Apiospora rasikravindrae TaxID=990691 RepID=A0ABR1SYW3_9PEZI